MFSDSALIFWGSACLVWASALRAWHSHLSWAAKPEQVATSWPARGNFPPVLLPCRFLVTLLSWEECAGVLWPRHGANTPCHKQQLRAPLLDFKVVQVILFHQQKLEIFLSGLRLIFLGCDHGTETFTLNCAECPNLPLPPGMGCIPQHSWLEKAHGIPTPTPEPDHELLHWAKHRLNQQFMWWLSTEQGNCFFKL